MTMFRTVFVASGLVLTASCGAAFAQAQSAGADSKTLTLQMPALPEAVRVTLKPAATALLVLDYVDPICKPQPKCIGEMLPALNGLMTRARKAGVVVAYGTRERTMSKWLPEIAPAAGDIKVVSVAQDRFYNTDLDKELKAKGITTIIMAGWKVSGSVVYTSVGATLHDYTVVVPVDTTGAATDYETVIGLYQILNQNSANATNVPLKPKASTLGRTDLITFQ